MQYSNAFYKKPLKFIKSQYTFKNIIAVILTFSRLIVGKKC